ncbi:hypothetical protein OHU25_07850 [Streptomyces sp. NBC_00117]|uniref:Uncharacterized protein n=1 Tax=Streptomyces sp. NBC_00119 TaxID=2975659 RepID=A0AAU1UJM0_9ACTN|nr:MULTISPECIES: hypothetical protein [unclassified Streptomyces]MCX4650209.1 hypothetical protein [Streptomyces sp. NBC_01446]MCX5320571.1 hypothetical protein [Streptomyces sp. NBC_00120]
MQFPEYGLDLQDGVLEEERGHLGGSGRAEPRKDRGRPQYLVRALELGVLLAQRGEFGAFVGGEPVVALARVGLGLPDPAAQGFRVHAEVGGQFLDLRLRVGGAVHPYRTLTQLQRVLSGGIAG